MATLKREMRVMKAWLDYLSQAAEVKVRQGDPRAIKTALGIARRRMKLMPDGNGENASDGGIPITIFSQAIREMERRAPKGGSGSSDDWEE